MKQDTSTIYIYQLSLYLNYVNKTKLGAINTKNVCENASHFHGGLVLSFPTNLSGLGDTHLKNWDNPCLVTVFTGMCVISCVFLAS